MDAVDVTLSLATLKPEIQMPQQRHREEAINTQLALLISKLGVAADAETIQVHGKHRPDVFFQLRGLRVVIEAKFEDTPNAEQTVLADARKRIRAGVAHIAAATVYPTALRTAPTTKVLAMLAAARLRYFIITETSESDMWSEGSPASLMEALRRAQESLSRDDIVEKTAQSLSTHLESVANLWSGQPGACDRLSRGIMHLKTPRTCGAPEPPDLRPDHPPPELFWTPIKRFDPPRGEDLALGVLFSIIPLSRLLGLSIPKAEKPQAAAERRETAAKISALVLANAFIFQEQLALSDERVDTLRKVKKSRDPVEAIAEHWRWIWENINYVPIFQLGERILDELPASPSTTEIVKVLADEAQKICAQQAALRHDLMGRIYHRLLHHAKYLGTYYTSVSAATLLLKLALDLEWPNDFGSARELADFKVADLACGTGTLLMAAAQALTDDFIKTRAGSDRDIETKDLSVLHSTLMQNVIHGYDILSSAVHLTASTLALLAPEVAFRQMNLFVMPIGMDHGYARLGSLDFLDDNPVRTQFALDNTQLDTVQTGAAQSAYANARVPQLDLCVMNPPFVSSRYGNRLFGSLPEERPTLQKALSAQAKKRGIRATAGLGALFVPLADTHTKPGGRIAFVLPIALASGEAWGTVRKFIADRYHLEVVITSHDPSRTNFSENTDLSELLFIARKLKRGEKAGDTAYVTLRRNPATIHQALDTAARLSTALQGLAGEQTSVTISSSGAALGEMTRLPAPNGNDNWTSGLFSQSFLARVHWELDTHSRLALPGASGQQSIPLCRLDALGGLGYDVRDITDAFEVDQTASQWTPYPGFWNHDAKRVVQLAQTPNAFLTARTKPIEGRNLKSAEAVWGKAGTVLLVSRLRTNTHKVLATGFNKKVLGNTWWAFDDDSLPGTQRKALLLWLNSTLGLLMYFGRRAITQGAWVQMKKPAWQAMPVLDVRNLDQGQTASLSATYDLVSKKALLPLAQLDSDPTRIHIDEALCEVLALPSLSPIRELLVREPGLTGREPARDGAAKLDTVAVSSPRY